MRYVIIHGDGMADWPCDELGGRTPLEAAHKPNMDLIASRGTLGLTLTIPAGMPPGSDVGTMSMMGYDPKRYHTGRAPIEAASMGIAMGPEDVVFRMNLVSLKDEGIEFFNGVSYRHLMVWRKGPRTTKLTPPHDITGKSIAGQLPEGEGAERI